MYFLIQHIKYEKYILICLFIVLFAYFKQQSSSTLSEYRYFIDWNNRIYGFTKEKISPNKLEKQIGKVEEAKLGCNLPSCRALKVVGIYQIKGVKPNKEKLRYLSGISITNVSSYNQVQNQDNYPKCRLFWFLSIYLVKPCYSASRDRLFGKLGCIRQSFFCSSRQVSWRKLMD